MIVGFFRVRPQKNRLQTIAVPEPAFQPRTNKSTAHGRRLSHPRRFILWAKDSATHTC